MKVLFEVLLLIAAASVVAMFVVGAWSAWKAVLDD